MGDRPPPPPPHGEMPRPQGSGGLPPGKYDIFVIPEHSAGSGFLYLPSLQPNINSFVAGFASALILVVVGQSLAPAFRTWWEGFQGIGNVGMGMLIIGVGFGAWSLGRTQTDPGHGHGHARHDSGASGGHGRPGGSAGFGGAYPGSAPPPEAGGPPPPPPPHGHQHSGSHGGGGAPPPHGSSQNAGPGYGYAEPPPRSPSPPPQPPPPPRTEPPPRPSPQPEPHPPRSEPPPPRPEPPPTPKQEKPKPAPKQQPPPPPPQSPPQPPKPTPEASAKGAWEKAREQAKGSWEKAREETRKREEERKAKEAEQKRRDEAAKRLAELRAKEAKERQQRELERKQKEKEAKDAQDRRDAEARAKDLAEKLEKERRERERLEKEVREREEARRKEKEEEDVRKRREEEARKKRQEEEAEQAAKASTERKAGGSYAFSGVGEKTSMWPNGRPPVPSESGARSTTSQTTTNSRKPPAPSARTYVSANEDAHSYRPYDKPKKPTRKNSLSSLGSESSWAQSHTTSRTSPPPSMRGAYATKDPDKIVISAVYLFMNQFAKTPASQLVSGIGSVTDGLILRITTEGLFIDDDVRGVPQREWDVKAWTLKSCETGEWKAKGLHILRATLRDQESKRYLFVVDEVEAWKVAVGLQRLQKGAQVRQVRNFGISGMPASEARGTLEMLGWGN